MACLQDLQSLQSIGTDLPARLAVDRAHLYIAEVMPCVTAHRHHLLDAQTQYTDRLEDLVKSVFVRGIQEAIAARDAWHHDKVHHPDFKLVQHDTSKALQLVHAFLAKTIRFCYAGSASARRHACSMQHLHTHMPKVSFASNHTADDSSAM